MDAGCNFNINVYFFINSLIICYETFIYLFIYLLIYLFTYTFTLFILLIYLLIYGNCVFSKNFYNRKLVETTRICAVPKVFIYHHADHKNLETDFVLRKTNAISRIWLILHKTQKCFYDSIKHLWWHSSEKIVDSR